MPWYHDTDNILHEYFFANMNSEFTNLQKSVPNEFPVAMCLWDLPRLQFFECTVWNGSKKSSLEVWCCKARDRGTAVAKVSLQDVRRCQSLFWNKKTWLNSSKISSNWDLTKLIQQIDSSNSMGVEWFACSFLEVQNHRTRYCNPTCQNFSPVSMGSEEHDWSRTRESKGETNASRGTLM